MRGRGQTVNWLDRTAISFEGFPFTWRELWDWVVRPLLVTYVMAVLLIAIVGR